MELIFRGKNVTLGEDFREYAARKLDRLSRYLSLAEHAIVDGRREAKGSDGRFVVQVTLNANGTFPRAEGRAAGAAAAGGGERERPRGVEIIPGRVVRRKQFAVKPMTEAEAVEQMELLGHNFFLFRDEDRQALALLYRRRDGDYGLILPESL